MKKNPKNFNIILVDDDLEDCMYFEEALRDINSAHIFQSFQSSEAVLSHLSLLDNSIPDILFLDLNMQGANGKDCLKDIRAIEKCFNLPIAIYSTSNRDQDKHDTLASGANIYITKPIDYGTLKNTIQKVLHINWQFHYLNLSISTFVVSV